MKTRFCIGLFAILMVSSPASSIAQTGGDRSPLDALPIAVEFAGSAAFATDYVFRGLSQTNSNPAPSGEIGWTLADVPLSPSFGMFASGIGFANGVEIDYILGVSQSFDPVTLALGWAYFQYPGSTDDDGNLDFYEVTAGLDAAFDLASFSFGYAYSPDYYAETGEAHYIGFGWDVPVPGTMLSGLSVIGDVGYQLVEDNDGFGTPDYVHWSVGLGYSLGAFDFSLAYTDTDIEDDACFPTVNEGAADNPMDDVTLGDNVCGESVVFSMGVSF